MSAISDSAQFEFASTATLSLTTPTTGSVTGGTTVTLRGTGFVQSHPFLCKFGSTVVAAATILDSTTATCVSPPSPSDSGNTLR